MGEEKEKKEIRGGGVREGRGEKRERGGGGGRGRRELTTCLAWYSLYNSEVHVHVGTLYTCTCTRCICTCTCTRVGEQSNIHV